MSSRTANLEQKINVTVAGTLINSVKVSVALTSAEVMDLAGYVD